ncbi:hypothetical protein CQ056_15680 [Peribacillus simplex]|nr:hypothetical protein CQ056_15680 [Peribacillus simplex]
MLLGKKLSMIGCLSIGNHPSPQVLILLIYNKKDCRRARLQWGNASKGETRQAQRAPRRLPDHPRKAGAGSSNQRSYCTGTKKL